MPAIEQSLDYRQKVQSQWEHFVSFGHCEHIKETTKENKALLFCQVYPLDALAQPAPPTDRGDQGETQCWKEGESSSHGQVAIATRRPACFWERCYMLVAVLGASAFLRIYIFNKLCSEQHLLAYPRFTLVQLHIWMGWCSSWKAQEKSCCSIFENASCMETTSPAQLPVQEAALRSAVHGDANRINATLTHLRRRNRCCPSA